LGSPVGFTADGQALMYPNVDHRGQLVRRLTPETADLRLRSPIKRTTPFDATRDAKWIVAGSTVTQIESTTADIENLRKKLGQPVTLDATVDEVRPTLSM